MQDTMNYISNAKYRFFIPILIWSDTTWNIHFYQLCGTLLLIPSFVLRDGLVSPRICGILTLVQLLLSEDSPKMN